jgi:hypothetical protein
MTKAKKYVTIEEGTDFRTIAKIMSERGYKMNHATARNVLINAIRRIMGFSADKIGTRITDAQMEAIIRDQDIHIALADVLQLAHEPAEEQEKDPTNGD